jgi:hypothetical protein
MPMPGGLPTSTSRCSGGSGADAQVSDRAWLQAMLDAERALAEASTQTEIVPLPAT